MWHTKIWYGITLHNVVSNGEVVRIADILPPAFDATCPSSPLVVYAERGLFSAEVNWTEPLATDNSGIVPTMSSNYKPFDRFSQGTHVITYTTTDQSGNKAICAFTIDVRGKNDTNLIQLTRTHLCVWNIRTVSDYTDVLDSFMRLSKGEIFKLKSMRRKGARN